MLSQLFGNGDWISTLVWFGLFIVFIFFGPRLMVTQTILKLEKDAKDLEEMAENARKYVFRSISKRPNAKLKNSIRDFMEFFAVQPVGTDPYGIMKKIDYIIRQSDQRFRYFVKQIAPELPKERQMNVKNALAGAITTHQIAKIVRHYIELVKKYKMFQMAMVIQMQIPLIKSIAKAAMHATDAFAKEIPIGDGIGALVVANLMKGKIKRFKDDEFVLVQTNINRRKVFIAKADGPGAATGYPGKFLQKLLKKQKIKRIITVDAGLRLEGEKPGTVAEGVGVAMGGSGVDRYEIEEIAVKRNIPLDAVAIKVSQEEALMPMKKEILKSVPKAIKIIKSTVNRAKKNEKILIIGVGNTCGIGNNFKSVKEAEKKIKKALKKQKKK
ncbi:MAG: DUF1512 family protein [Candidatus Aenigmatarchaeota archaeon]